MNLDDHIHILRCYFVRVIGGIPRIFIEYVEGGSLIQRIRSHSLYQGGQQQALVRILDIAIQFAWGLHAAHEQGVVHQDIKPDNVLLSEQGIVKVSDFGLAKARTRAGEILGNEAWKQQNPLVSVGGMTPAYCSPEQAAGRGVNHQTDIWSWGVSVLVMFTGKVIWRMGPLAANALKGSPEEEQWPIRMPEEVREVLRRCLQPQPEARPNTMLEVAIELEAIFAHLMGILYPYEMPVLESEQLNRLIARGVSLQELGRLEEALSTLEEAIRLNPSLHQLLQNKAVILAEQGRLQEALSTLEEAIRLNPGYVSAHETKSHVLIRLERLQEALEAYEQGIKLDPTNVSAYVDNGNLLRRLGRSQEALEAYEKALKLDPGHILSYYNKGNALVGLGRMREALEAYEQALKLDPTNAIILTNKGNVLFQQNKLQEALTTYEQAIKLNPMAPLPTRAKGWCSFN